MVNWAEAVTVDFETLPISDLKRPYYPPEPVGVAIKVGNKKSRYYAWGHPSNNNCSWGDARRTLGELWDSGRPILCHHEKFDIDIMETCLGLPHLSWDRYHDTMFMLYLDEPRARTYRLKDTAERLLGEPPEERDGLVDHLVESQPVPTIRLKHQGRKTYAGAFVAFADGRVAATYACGDTDRTHKLAKLVHKDILARGMGEAYDLERRLFPQLLQMERQGVRVDHEQLSRDVARYTKVLEKIDHWLCKKLRVKGDINLDSGPQLAKALVVSGLSAEQDFGRTPTGLMQTNKQALEGAIKDLQLLNVLKYRAQLSTCLGTFMRRWLRTADLSGGLIYTEWHSTRDGDHGTSTGRLSSTPNFQNIPNVFKRLFNQKGLPKAPFTLPRLPQVRRYIVPYEKGHVLIDRDFSQQELRILGHFEGGALMEAYNQNPWLDLHSHAQTLINQLLRKDFERKHIKNTGFGLVYGMGVGKLAVQSETTVKEAKEVKEAYLQIFPGLRELYRIMKARADKDDPIYTWLGREYYCEPPKFVEGRMKKFDYKLLNLLIQGSAADTTKVATDQYCAAKPKHHRLHLITHDELCASVPLEELHSAMVIMKQAMETGRIKFDVPMLSEGVVGPNHEDMVPYDKKGERMSLPKTAMKGVW